jgi:hypothetical protein
MSGMSDKPSNLNETYLCLLPAAKASLKQPQQYLE